MSRRPAEFVVFGFGSTHDALAAEAALEEGGIDVVPVPPPAALTSLCGIALRLPSAQVERARALLGSAGLPSTSEAAILDM